MGSTGTPRCACPVRPARTGRDDHTPRSPPASDHAVRPPGVPGRDRARWFVPTADLDASGTIDVPTPSTTTVDSLIALVDWLTGAAPLPTLWIWTTDGPG